MRFSLKMLELQQRLLLQAGTGGDTQDATVASDPEDVSDADSGPEVTQIAGMNFVSAEE